MLRQKGRGLVLDGVEKIGPPREPRTLDPESSALEVQIDALIRGLEAELVDASPNAVRELKRAKRDLTKAKGRIKAANRA